MIIHPRCQWKMINHIGKLTYLLEINAHFHQWSEHRSFSLIFGRFLHRPFLRQLKYLDWQNNFCTMQINWNLLENWNFLITLLERLWNNAKYSMVAFNRMFKMNKKYLKYRLHGLWLLRSSDLDSTKRENWTWALF